MAVDNYSVPTYDQVKAYFQFVLRSLRRAGLRTSISSLLSRKIEKELAPEDARYFYKVEDSGFNHSRCKKSFCRSMQAINRLPSG